MKVTALHRRPSGYVSYLVVLSMGALLLLLMVFAYRRASTSRSVQAGVQLQVDYSEKEETVLRSIVAITPNRAIRAMQSLSNASTNTTVRDSLRWENIFNEALLLANARQSISSPVLASLGTTSPIMANTGDYPGAKLVIFKALGGATGYISSGVSASPITGCPVPLTCTNTTDATNDVIWPIISTSKVYGTVAQNGVGANPLYNIITYPNINFGYTRPGQPFVAKRNWWGFSMDLAEPNSAVTHAVRSRRNFVLSIYEIPSQLPISASSFMELGQYAAGDAWENINIDGGIFAGRAVVEGSTALPALATRRGATLSTNTTVGGQSFTGDPFAPGVREAYQLTQGDFFPVSLASESGRAAFIPINRGEDFFDRFANATETSVLSSTTWNNYSIGALQCAMRLDITAADATKMPTTLRFSYLKTENGVKVRKETTLSMAANSATSLPSDYVALSPYKDGQKTTFPSGSYPAVVDLAYGSTGKYIYKTSQTGTITFSTKAFGDPGGKAPKGGYLGYYRPSRPFEVKPLTSRIGNKYCVAIYPKRIAGFLAALGADNTAVNHSLVVNVDYTSATGSTLLSKPDIPCSEMDYGVIMQECSDLTSFTKGFSLVTNMRLYIGDDFNMTATTPPSGYSPPGLYYPPCSVFSPERRFGVDLIPFGVGLSGQVVSLASESANDPISPLDSKVLNGDVVAANRIHMNLRPISHPAELPPIYMMNWLVLLEERKGEFYVGN